MGYFLKKADLLLTEDPTTIIKLNYSRYYHDTIADGPALAHKAKQTN